MAVERPHTHRAVVAAGGDPLAVRAEGDGAHAAGVAPEDGLAHGREGPQLLRARQLGQQRAGVDVEPVLADAGRQVQVEAALEALLDELAVGGHLAQGVELAGRYSFSRSSGSSFSQASFSSAVGRYSGGGL